MKTTELTGAALDWAVAKCEGVRDDILFDFVDGEWLGGIYRLVRVERRVSPAG